MGRTHHVLGWPPLHPDCCTMLFFSDDEGWGRLFANSPQDRANTTCRCSFEHGKQLIFYLIFYLISVIFINYIYNSIYLTFFAGQKEQQSVAIASWPFSGNPLERWSFCGSSFREDSQWCHSSDCWTPNSAHRVVTRWYSRWVVYRRVGHHLRTGINFSFI